MQEGNDPGEVLRFWFGTLDDGGRVAPEIRRRWFARDDAFDRQILERFGALDFARRHRDVIDRFGRFPHRNAELGRTTTAEEAAWLAARDTPF